MTEIYPIDIEALNKGDIIPAERLEDITNTVAGTDAFKLKVLALRQKIENDRFAMGKPVVVRGVNGDCLKILTDAEASPYLDNRAEQHLEGIKACVFKLGQSVDVGNLNDEEIRHHDMRVLVHGRVLQGALAGRKSALKVLAYKRKNPGLPAPVPETVCGTA